MPIEGKGSAWVFVICVISASLRHQGLFVLLCGRNRVVSQSLGSVSRARLFRPRRWPPQFWSALFARAAHLIHGSSVPRLAGFHARRDPSARSSWPLPALHFLFSLALLPQWRAPGLSARCHVRPYHGGRPVAE